jgi:hypothetical protein
LGGFIHFFPAFNYNKHKAEFNEKENGQWVHSGTIHSIPPDSKQPSSLLNYLEDKGRRKHQNSYQMVVFPQKNSLNLTVLRDLIESQNRNRNYTHPIDT